VARDGTHSDIVGHIAIIRLGDVLGLTFDIVGRHESRCSFQGIAAGGPEPFDHFRLTGHRSFVPRDSPNHGIDLADQKISDPPNRLKFSDGIRKFQTFDRMVSGQAWR
jgi:hypothetical protein